MAKDRKNPMAFHQLGTRAVPARPVALPDLAHLQVMRAIAANEPWRSHLEEYGCEGATAEQARAAIVGLLKVGTIEEWQIEKTGAIRLRFAGTGNRRIAMSDAERRARAEAIDSMINAAELTLLAMTAAKRGDVAGAAKIMADLALEKARGLAAARRADAEKKRGQS